MKKIKQYIAKIKSIVLGYKTPACIGLDIASTAVKMVELVPNTLKITKYTIAPLTKNMVSEGVINEIEKVSDIIRDQWVKLNPTNQNVAIAIPYNAIIIKEVKAPLFKDKYELDQFILSQLIKELDTDDIDFDYSVINKETSEQLLSVVVAKKEKIEEYQAIIQMTGIQVAAIDVEPFAIQHLLKLLLNRNRINGKVILLDLGATKVRAFVFDDYEPVIFNEIIVNYSHLFEELLLKLDQRVRLQDVTDLYGNTLKLLNEKNMTDDELIALMLSDVAKILQLIRSNLLVERKISLAANVPIVLMGGNTLIPGLIERIISYTKSDVKSIASLFQGGNSSIPEVDLLRIVTAISLATWGQEIE
ncbi:MAG: pilus assembly protein PilM [Burkholderiales bacterium]|jgi:type IV pilus assembly protein PilM|nr:pilus assembly protein PilM [Burkholderiales bacterium]